MSQVVANPINLPVIQRNADWCLLILVDALQGLTDLCQPESDEANEQLNLLIRSDLAAVFTLLHDYAQAARLVLPEHESVKPERSAA